MDIGIYFGSMTGHTENVSDLISDFFHETTSVDYIENFTPEALSKFDLIIFGIPTWNVGELESSWEEFFPSLDNFDFSNKIVTIFGLGDQANYPDTFLDAMGILYDKLIDRHAIVIGKWQLVYYYFSDSLGFQDGFFVGLALDEDNQLDKTDKRIKTWIVQLRNEYSQIETELIA